MPHLSDAQPVDGGEPTLHFAPPTKDHIQNCSYDAWFSKYRSSCIKSRILALPSVVVDYLLEDGIVLADDEPLPEGDNDDDDDDDWHTSGADHTPRAQEMASDSEDEEEDEPPRPPPNERFPEFHSQIKAVIAELGGSVAPKLNWSSPKDAKWISPHQNTLKCTTPNDVYLLLKSSNFISHDLVHAFDGCTAAAPSRPFRPVLVLRPFFTPHVALEFRCFVKNRSLVAISQRDPNYYAFLQDLRPKLHRKIRAFFRDTLRMTFPDASFAFDVYVPEDPFQDDGLGKVRLMDINPWALKTDPLLFVWEELLEMQVRRPLYGSVSEQKPEDLVVRLSLHGSAAGEAEGDTSDDTGLDTETDDDDEDQDEYRPDGATEFRIVERDDPAAFNFSSSEYSAHKLPKEVVDASLAGEGGMRAFAAQWREMTQGRGGDMWSNPGSSR